MVFDLFSKRHHFGIVTISDKTFFKIKVFWACLVNMRVEMSLLEVSQHPCIITYHHSFSQKSSKNLTIWLNVGKITSFWGKSRSFHYILSITHDISSFVYSFSSIINGFGHFLSIFRHFFSIFTIFHQLFMIYR